MEWFADAWIWFQENATTIAVIEFVVFVSGGIWSVLNFFALRRERKAAQIERKAAQMEREQAVQRHVELLAKMKQMVGKPVKEQRIILQEAITVTESFEMVLTKPDGTIETRGGDQG